jgi:hypothetical protein
MRFSLRKLRRSMIIAGWAGCAVACGTPEATDTSAAHKPASRAQRGGDVSAAAGSGGQHAAAGDCPSFESSFAAIEKVIFEAHGCTAAACHGAAASGGMDLRPGSAHENLVNAQSTSSKLARVQPGSATDSFLYEKLAAATMPDRVKTTGSPMPVGTAPLSRDELEAVRIWILHSAPETGNVDDPTTGATVGKLLAACTPPAKPIKATPLEMPASNEGVQFVLPGYTLEAGTEIEQCTPFAYDYTDKVPAEYKDESRNVMFVNSSRVLQDPSSHHMVVWNPSQGLGSVPDSGWTCHGGARHGLPCNASNLDCGAEAACAGPAAPGTFCQSSGPGSLSTGLPAQIANTQSPQEYVPPFDGGVYWEIPLKGVLWFNSHAFNLSAQETILDARMNFFFARERTRKMVPVNVVKNQVPNGLAPFTKHEYCSTAIVPQNNSIAMMAGHTHRRGKHFWAKDATGKQIYESFIYNDPVYQHYDPWLQFTAPDEASRTIQFCAEFNNGVNEDGAPDLDLVTRKSRMPARATCTPTACTAGNIGARCSTNNDCNSAPDADDGECDACPITTGVTTENEMFVLMPWYVLPATQ